MARIMIAIAGLFMVVGNGYSHLIPIRWSAHLGLQSLADIPNALQSAPVMPAGQATTLLMEKDGSQLSVKICQAYLRNKKQGYAAANNAELATASFYLRYCQVLADLKRAIPAKKTAWGAFDWRKDYGLMPASLLMPSWFGASVTGTLASRYPRVKVQYLAHDQGLRLQQGQQVTVLNPLAAADVNHDGWLDRLYMASYYMVGGSFHDYALFWLTRYQPTGAIQEVKNI